jgi:hypothetical protein
LYKKLLYKSEFGQAHCIEWFKNIHTKFNLPFLDIPTSFYEFLEVCPIFWELNQLKNDLKSPHNAGPKSACGPAAEATCVLTLLRTHRRAGTWSPRAARTRDVVVTEGPVVASRWQSVAGELTGTTERALGNKSGGGAHRGDGAMTGQRGGSVRWRAAGSLPEGGSAVSPTSSGSCGGGRER